MSKIILLRINVIINAVHYKETVRWSFGVRNIVKNNFLQLFEFRMISEKITHIDGSPFAAKSGNFGLIRRNIPYERIRKFPKRTRKISNFRRVFLIP